jgi:hypothetical protein
MQPLPGNAFAKKKNTFSRKRLENNECFLRGPCSDAIPETSLEVSCERVVGYSSVTK